MWLAVDRDGTERTYGSEPFRDKWCGWLEDIGLEENRMFEGVEMPEGTIEKLIGKKLTWNDEPFNYDAYVAISK